MMPRCLPFEGQLRTTDVRFRADYKSLDERLSAELGDCGRSNQ
jgi:hypothetical protein